MNITISNITTYISINPIQIVSIFLDLDETLPIYVREVYCKNVCIFTKKENYIY